MTRGYTRRMDIEQLSKSQIVLLTLLVSFVTSIATGIVTVSLMDQAPPAIAQTVNRVIEHTVQTVVPAGQPASAAVTQEKTVIVNESDLISQAVASVSPSVVRLYTNDAQNPTFLGLGVVVDASGTIATDSGGIGEAADAVVELPDSTHVRAFVTSRDESSGIVILSPATTTVEGGVPAWTPIKVSGQQVVLGETVVMIAGDTLARIGDGIVTSLAPLSTGSASQIIETDIGPDSIMPGSPLIDTNGDLVGLSTGAVRSVSSSAFVDVSALMQDLGRAPAPGASKSNK